MVRIKKRDVVSPELMAAESAQDLNQLRDRSWRSRGVRVASMSDNTNDSILCQRASSPGPFALRREPVVSIVMLHVGGVDEGDQYIDVEQKPGHGSSSWSWRTNSDVTRGAPGRTASSGMPLRVRRAGEAGRKAVRASDEITSPTLLRS